MPNIHARNTLSGAVACSILAAGGMLAAEPVRAAGFYIQEQSVSGLGRAFAGEAAVARDASTVFFNPAGMTSLSGPELQLASHLLMPKAEVENDGSTVTTPGTGGAPVPVSGGSGGNPYDPTPVPNLFYARPLSADTWIGFGITAPFGLVNDYDEDFFARYDSTETDLKVLNLQPSLAYRVSDRLSIGGGLDIQRAKATLKSAIPDPTVPGGPTVATDGEQRLDADSWDFGFNLGMTWQATPATRLGAHYRQGIEHELDGEASVRYPTGLAAMQGTPGYSKDGKATLHLPDMLALGASHELNDRWTLMAQYKWFNWSNFDEIRIRFDDGSPDSTTVQNYGDSWALALGAEYMLNGQWTLRGGLQFDRTPTRDGYRTTRTPDGDRLWYSLGASYATGDRWALDLAYTYIDIASEPLDLTRDFFASNPALASSAGIDGEIQGHVHILAAAVRYHF
ncbi:OmpP1/FadL family transporter [Ectothiorhodospira mobilis]|uniref:OmpP1/FadL family transporter n=1 Tax=Ectothiorhodospira mobilis TaxID=195064 RepID=UPI0019049021|nr:outer membrane protein transport protein [Ectothiorhodospira mobilis]MBK1691772.1 aromatic hydrocarbon degradation protein [Ectothiorhodospira mobilis]